MEMTTGGFIKCPKCGATLPATNRVCQFCGTDVSGLTKGYVPPSDTDYKPHGAGLPRKWVFGFYYAICAYYVYLGASYLLRALGVFGRVSELVQAVLGIAGVITLVISIGMIFRLEIVRGIVNFFCGIQLILGFLGLVMGVMASATFGLGGFMLVVNSVIQIATSGFMIYLIGETDLRGPSF